MDARQHAEQNSISEHHGSPCRTGTPIALQFQSLRIGGFSEARERVIRVLASESLTVEEGLDYNGKCRRSYEQLAMLNASGLSARRLWENPRELLALLEVTSVTNPSLSMLVSTHHFLTFGAIRSLGGDRDDLKSLIDDLDDLRSVGTFVITEEGHGNSHAQLKTVLTLNAEEQEVVLNTPVAAAQKVMSANALPGIAKVGVVMARLIASGEDRGVVGVLLQLRDKEGVKPGISIEPLPESPYTPTDYARLTFQNVHLPINRVLHPNLDQLLAPSGIRDAQTQDSRSLALRQNAWIAFAVQLSAVGRASVSIALRHAYRRNTQSNGDTPSEAALATFGSHMMVMFEALSIVIATTCLVDRATRAWVQNDEGAANLGPSWKAGTALGRTLSLVRILAAKQADYVAGTCTRRLGARGVFTINRVAVYHGLTTILHPAAGDVNLTALAAMRSLAWEQEYVPPTRDGTSSHRMQDPEFWLDIAVARERLLHQELKHQLIQRTKDRHVDERVWDEVSEVGLRLTDAHVQRLQFEAFVDFANSSSEVWSGSVALLLVLHASKILAEESAWYVANGLLSFEQLKEISVLRTHICASLVPYALEIVGMFDPGDLLEIPS